MIEDKLKRLEEIADEPCTCTSDQLSGKDPTVCKSCEAASILNDIYSYISDKYRYFMTGEND